MNKFLSIAVLSLLALAFSALTSPKNTLPQDRPTVDLVITDVKKICNSNQTRSVITIVNEGNA